MKIFRNIFILILVFVAQSAFASGYPDYGFSTGNGVRLRESPSTDSKILGRVDESSMLVLLGEVKAGGKTWYKVEHPTKRGTAWIFGEYVDNYASFDTDTPAYKTLVQLFRDCGVTAEKARVLLGKPKRTSKRKFFFDPANQDFHEEVLEYPTFKLQYIEGRLRHVESSGEALSFGDVSVGDTTAQVLDVLGEPDGKGDEGWSYEVSPRDVLLFEFRGGRVAKMTFDNYID
ncbi:MAG: SH3 domain-containing protein [Synergistaceae bacterium]|nr:SH3 domain-containing protein [Synergistaceae bacterium]